MDTAVVQAFAHYLPERRLRNEELAEVYPAWTAEKILKKTGIRERSIAAEDEFVSDLAVAAAERLLEETGFPRKDIDLLVLCTQTPDYFLPSTACLVQARLGLGTATAAFDFSLGCSGYPYGLAIVRGLLESRVARNALLIMAETYSKHIHPLDKSVRTLFGDAASATLVTLERRDAAALGPFVLGTDGLGAENLIVRRGAGRGRVRQPEPETVDENGNVRTDANLYMNGTAIFEFTIRRIPEVVGELLRRAELRPEDIQWFVFHQANEYMLRYLQRKIGIPDERFPLHFAHCGNTVSATIPIVLENLVTRGQVQRGDRIMSVGFGVGYSWGANLIRWEPGL